MIVETMILSLLISKIKGGKIRNLEYLHIKAWYLFIVAFSIKVLSLLIISRFDNKLNDLILNNFQYIHISIYLLLIIGLAVNSNSSGLKLTLFGSILNFMPMLYNKGKMPVSREALIYTGQYHQLSLLEEGRIMTHVLANKSTKLIYLGDIIPIAEPYIFPKIISIGDLLIALGIFILIQNHMKIKKYDI